MLKLPYTVQDVLSQLDQRAEAYGVPFLDDGGCYPVECRCSVYRDSNYWAIVIENIVFGPRGVGHGGVATNVYSYGNCLKAKSGDSNFHQFHFTSDGPESPTFTFGDPPCDDLTGPWEYVHPNATTICVRGRVVPFDTDPASYEEMGITLIDPPHIKGHELLRGLPLRYRRMLL